MITSEEKIEAFHAGKRIYCVQHTYHIGKCNVDVKVTSFDDRALTAEDLAEISKWCAEKAAELK